MAKLEVVSLDRPPKIQCPESYGDTANAFGQPICQIFCGRCIRFNPNKSDGAKTMRNSFGQ